MRVIRTQRADRICPNENGLQHVILKGGQTDPPLPAPDADLRNGFRLCRPTTAPVRPPETTEQAFSVQMEGGICLWV